MRYDLTTTATVMMMMMMKKVAIKVWIVRSGKGFDDAMCSFA